VSFNRFALVAAQSLLPVGASLDIFELDGIPVYNHDLDKQPGAHPRGGPILFATPEYNYSVPGALKNAIDWASRPYGDSAWQGKPVAVMSASVGILGGARAQYHLRQSSCSSTCIRSTSRRC
jgi:chromate reductase